MIRLIFKDDPTLWLRGTKIFSFIQRQLYYSYDHLLSSVCITLWSKTNYQIYTHRKRVIFHASNIDCSLIIECVRCSSEHLMEFHPSQIKPQPHLWIENNRNSSSWSHGPPFCLNATLRQWLMGISAVRSGTDRRSRKLSGLFHWTNARWRTGKTVRMTAISFVLLLRFRYAHRKKDTCARGASKLVELVADQCRKELDDFEEPHSLQVRYKTYACDRNFTMSCYF